MEIELRQGSQVPVYRQIAEAVAGQIADGRLTPGDKLPTVRQLAEETGLAQGTVKHAYDELEKEGFIYTIAAKGCFVAPKNVELLREETLKAIENRIDQIVRLSQSVGLSRQEVLDTVKFAMED